jgi:hypothetical protein
MGGSLLLRGVQSSGSEGDFMNLLLSAVLLLQEKRVEKPHEIPLGSASGFGLSLVKPAKG